jgi:hypothetical protein
MAMFVAAFDAPLLILAACSLVLAAGGVLLAIATSRLPDDERAW